MGANKSEASNDVLDVPVKPKVQSVEIASSENITANAKEKEIANLLNMTYEMQAGAVKLGLLNVYSPEGLLQVKKEYIDSIKESVGDMFLDSGLSEEIREKLSSDNPDIVIDALKRMGVKIPEFKIELGQAQVDYIKAMEVINKYVEKDTASPENEGDEKRPSGGAFVIFTIKDGVKFNEFANALEAQKIKDFLEATGQVNESFINAVTLRKIVL